MDAVVDSTLRFVLAVKWICCPWVKWLLTCNWSFCGFHNNQSVVTPSSFSRENVGCVSCTSLGMVFMNVEWLDAHFLNVSPAVCSRDVNSLCSLIASSTVEIPLSKLSTLKSLLSTWTALRYWTLLSSANFFRHRVARNGAEEVP